MTAEIAILNKSAVALAADSAVTITTGDREEKTFDSADKLFELCRHNPIGIMVYNGLGFAEAPLQSLIKKYRSECRHFGKVEAAAFDFLNYLNAFGAKASQRVKDDSIKSLVIPILQRIRNRAVREIRTKLFEQEFKDGKTIQDL
jgi:hypothetical protein